MARPLRCARTATRWLTDPTGRGEPNDRAPAGRRGNFHAKKKTIERSELTPAVVHLPSAEVISLYAVPQGGTAWNCGRDACGANPLPEAYDASARGVIVQPYGSGAFDGVLAFGPSTPSEPAKP